jgi:hypothetical protein
VSGSGAAKFEISFRPLLKEEILGVGHAKVLAGGQRYTGLVFRPDGIVAQQQGHHADVGDVAIDSILLARSAHDIEIEFP